MRVLTTPPLLAPPSDLLVEEIGMTPGAHEVKFVASDAVDYEPIRFDMSLPVTSEISTQWMVTIALGQPFLMNQQGQERIQLVQILALSLGPPRVAFEPGRPNRDQHARS